VRPATLATDKVALELPTIARRLKELTLPEVDAVVGIASGGVVPAAIIAYELELPLKLIAVNYRDDANRPRFAAPQLLGGVPRLPQRLLLVDDVSVSGQTLALAKQALGDRSVYTMVLKGHADIVLFPEIQRCVAWPWQGAPNAETT